MTARLIGLSALLYLAAGPALSQTPMGTEFQVNTNTASSWYASTASDASGNFVVAWRRIDAQYIAARRFDRFGNPRGDQFRVNASPAPSSSFDPAVIMAPDGEFVVVWHGPILDGDITARRFNGLGQPTGSEFLVNSYTTGRQMHATGALHPVTKDLVVVWQDDSGHDGWGAGVFAQRFDASNARVGSEFLVNALNTNGQQLVGGVDFGPGGEFIIAWADWGNQTGINSSHARRYDGAGNPIGTPFVIGTTPATGHKRSPRPRYAPDGTILVAFVDGDGDGEGIAVRRFSATGAPVGAQLQVNTHTTSTQRNPWVALDAAGNYVVQWRDFAGDGSGGSVKARFFSHDDTAFSGELLVNTFTTGDQRTSANAASVSCDPAGNVVIVWDTSPSGHPGGPFRISAQRYASGFQPTGVETDTLGNGVVEPGETANLRPSWANRGLLAQVVGGTLSNIAGPTGASYQIVDGSADYGTVPPATSAVCIDCYEVSISDPPARPALHWDFRVTETLTTGNRHEWGLHVGRSFVDVNPTNTAYRYIETAVHHSLTTGCRGSDPSLFCPDRSLTRGQIAPVVLLAKEGPAYQPPPCIGRGLFTDVRADDPLCPWIEELARRGVVSGCTTRAYCPNRSISRAETAVVLVRTLDSTVVPPACVPPNFYADVPETHPYCPWVEEVSRRGMTANCGSGNFCPDRHLSRGDMAEFVTLAFGLVLYGL